MSGAILARIPSPDVIEGSPGRQRYANSQANLVHISRLLSLGCPRILPVPFLTRGREPRVNFFHRQSRLSGIDPGGDSVEMSDHFGGEAMLEVPSILSQLLRYHVFDIGID